MATTLVKPGGRLICLEGIKPHTTTVPFDLRARLCEPPAAMAATSRNSAGGEQCPEELLPQHATVPSDLRATLWEPPAAMAVTREPNRPGEGSVAIRPDAVSRPD